MGLLNFAVVIVLVMTVLAVLARRSPVQPVKTNDATIQVVADCRSLVARAEDEGLPLEARLRYSERALGMVCTLRHMADSQEALGLRDQCVVVRGRVVSRMASYR